MPPYMVTTAGLSTTRASTTVFRRESASESTLPDRRSAAGPIQDPHFTSQNSAASQSSAGPSSAGPRSSAPFENSAGPLSSAGPASSAGPLNSAGPLQDPYYASFSDSTTSRSRLMAGPGPPSDGPAGRFFALTRDVSPFQRQHSVVRRSRHVSPSEPLIVFDDADQHDAVTHRQQSSEAPEVRFDRVWERTPVRSRRRSRRRVSSRRRHRRRRDSSESSDSDDDRRPRAREFTALTTVPRREREQGPECGSVSSQRFATWDHASPRVSGFPATLTTDRPPANVGVKLGTYDGNSCLETFLASLRNFATYLNWNEEDELFHLRASLKGPAGQ